MTMIPGINSMKADDHLAQGEISAAHRRLFGNVARQLRRHEYKCWFFGDSIGFEGLIAASDLLGAPGWYDFALGFCRGWAARIEPFRADDFSAPGHVLCTLAERSGDLILTQATIRLAEHLWARRRARGASITFEDTLRCLQQPYGGVPLDAGQQALMHDPGAGIWLDCLHFDPPFYAHLSRVSGHSEWAHRAVGEALSYCELLADPELGLLKHFWLERTDQTYTRGWGRGQGWALLGLMDVIEHADSSTPRYEAVVGKACDLATAMLRFQLADGNWWAMVHEPDSGAESSTAAFMATAFYRGIALGVLEPGIFIGPAERAYAAMLANLDDDGVLRGVSAAVNAALVQQHYWHVPRGLVVPWGQGPVLTAALARHAVMQERSIRE
jgi:unsaturated rhamnogalacturonyl hydrolase